jgi:hypothetical protein
MKHLLGSSRNIRLAVNDQKEKTIVEPEIECILALIENNFEFEATDVKSVPKISSFRFGLDLEGAKHLRDSLDTWIEEAESLNGRQLEFKIEE